MGLRVIESVEIFKAGTWNGTEFSAADVSAMLDAFGKADFKIPVKLGHTDNPGEPAHGWVTALRRVGDTLVADIEVQEELYQAISDRKYEHVSVEIAIDMQRGDIVHPLAITAVAILGAETPGVAGLAPLSAAIKFTARKRLTVKFSATKGAAMPADETIQLKAELEQFRAQVAMLSRDKRTREVKDFGAKIQIPAFRPHLIALAQIVSGDTRTLRKFADEGLVDPAALPSELLPDAAKEMEDMTPMAILEKIIAMLNELAVAMQGTVSAPGTTGDTVVAALRAQKTPAELVKARALELQAKDSNLDFGAAMARALKADSKLADAYYATKGGLN